MDVLVLVVVVVEIFCEENFGIEPNKRSGGVRRTAWGPIFNRGALVNGPIQRTCVGFAPGGPDWNVAQGPTYSLDYSGGLSTEASLQKSISCHRTIFWPQRIRFGLTQPAN